MISIYNAERTAYKRPWIDTWYLVPDGKTRAPLFFLGEGPMLGSIRVWDLMYEEHMNLLTQKDRVVLLEAINAGCFTSVWCELQGVLRERADDNLKSLMRFVDS